MPKGRPASFAIATGTVVFVAPVSIMKGMDKVILNPEKINQDLEENWVVIAEAIQTILRREQYPDPYEALKKLTRTNKKVDMASLHKFIDGLKIPQKLKSELKNITPANYTGINII